MKQTVYIVLLVFLVLVSCGNNSSDKRAIPRSFPRAQVKKTKNSNNSQSQNSELMLFKNEKFGFEFSTSYQLTDSFDMEADSMFAFEFGERYFDIDIWSLEDIDFQEGKDSLSEIILYELEGGDLDENSELLSIETLCHRSAVFRSYYVDIDDVTLVDYVAIFWRENDDAYFLLMLGGNKGDETELEHLVRNFMLF